MVDQPSRRTFLQQAAAIAAAPHLASRASRRSQERIPYVDGLSFLPDDPASFRESGLTAFILDASSGETVENEDGTARYYRSFEACSKSITAVRRSLRDEIDEAFLATRGSDVDDALRRGTTAVFLQFQGCEPLGEDLARLDMFYELGLRVLQITHHHDNPFGGGALEVEHVGLTELGFQAVEQMNELGVIPDVSHGSDPTSLDVARTSTNPVILSHGAVRALVPNARCAPDEVVRAIADTGGMIGIFMMSFWLTTDPVPTVEHLLRQIRHVIDVGGIDAVGIANDYQITGHAGLTEVNNNNAEGIKGYYPWWQSMAERGVFGFDELPEHVVIPELNDVHRMRTIHHALEAGGFTATQVEKVMGGNWIRVLKESLG
jgi:membrane dipeptidase